MSLYYGIILSIDLNLYIKLFSDKTVLEERTFDTSKKRKRTKGKRQINSKSKKTVEKRKGKFLGIGIMATNNTLVKNH